MAGGRICKMYLDSFNNLLTIEGKLWTHGRKNMFVIGKPGLTPNLNFEFMFTVGWVLINIYYTEVLKR